MRIPEENTEIGIRRGMREIGIITSWRIETMVMTMAAGNSGLYIIISFSWEVIFMSETNCVYSRRL